MLAAAPDAVGRVVFSGVGKTAAEIDLALKTGILQFNVESEAELELLAARARKLKIRARFALRVNPDVFADTHPYISTGLREHKFGIDIRRALAHLQERGRQPLARSAWRQRPHRLADPLGGPFGAAIERVSKLVQQLGREGIVLQAIDAGGGLGIDYHAGRHFDARGQGAGIRRGARNTRWAISKAACSSSPAASWSPRPARCWRACSTSSATAKKPS